MTTETDTRAALAAYLDRWRAGGGDETDPESVAGMLSCLSGDPWAPYRATIFKVHVTDSRGCAWGSLAGGGTLADGRPEGWLTPMPHGGSVGSATLLDALCALAAAGVPMPGLPPASEPAWVETPGPGMADRYGLPCVEDAPPAVDRAAGRATPADVEDAYRRLRTARERAGLDPETGGPATPGREGEREMTTDYERPNTGNLGASPDIPARQEHERAFATWHPQWGGYASPCVVEFGAVTGSAEGDPGCFDVLNWHDGEFPTDTVQSRLHYCDALQVVEFGVTVAEKLTARQTRPDGTPVRYDREQVEALARRLLALAEVTP